jgi:hypothetical protein
VGDKPSSSVDLSTFFTFTCGRFGRGMMTYLHNQPSPLLTQLSYSQNILITAILHHIIQRPIIIILQIRIQARPPQLSHEFQP